MSALPLDFDWLRDRMVTAASQAMQSAGIDTEPAHHALVAEMTELAREVERELAVDKPSTRLEPGYHGGEQAPHEGRAQEREGGPGGSCPNQAARPLLGSSAPIAKSSMLRTFAVALSPLAELHDVRISDAGPHTITVEATLGARAEATTVRVSVTVGGDLQEALDRIAETASQLLEWREVKS